MQQAIVALMQVQKYASKQADGVSHFRRVSESLFLSATREHTVLYVTYCLRTKKALGETSIDLLSESLPSVKRYRSGRRC